MRAVRVWVGLAMVLAVVWLAAYGSTRQVSAAYDPLCYNKYKCRVAFACKDVVIIGNVEDQLGCFDQDGHPISGQCKCKINDGTKNNLCSATQNAADNCVANRGSIKRCDGTYVPTGQPAEEFCSYHFFECDPLAPVDKDGKPVACATAD